jgi:hypothetical protein
VQCSGVLTFENVCFLVVGEVDCGMLRIFWCRALVTCICIHTDTDTDTHTHKHTHTHTHTHIASCCSSFVSCAAIALHVLRVRGETEPLEAPAAGGGGGGAGGVGVVGWGGDGVNRGTVNGCGVGRQDVGGRECGGRGGGGSVDGVEYFCRMFCLLLRHTFSKVLVFVYAFIFSEYFCCIFCLLLKHTFSKVLFYSAFTW